MLRRILSDALEAVAVALLCFIIYGLCSSPWWALLPAAAYLGLVSFLLDRGKR